MDIIEPNLDQIKQLANPTAGKRGRPPTRRRGREIKRKLREGATKIDQGWLLEQLMTVYNSRDCRAAEKLRALELMAKISGFDAEKNTDERAALQQLMRDLESESETYPNAGTSE